MRKNIIFCGGGSGGHVLPAITLIKRIKEIQRDAQVSCIGGHFGIEASLLKDYNYKSISTGKLRRYLSFQNIIDLFKVSLGIAQAYFELFSYKSSETIIISTGGFVTIPVVIAGWLQGKPIVLHEQTTRAGLANRITSLFAKKCLLTFKESLEFFPKEKSIHLGYPLRKEILENVTNQIAAYKGYEHLPLLFLTGGGNGSKLLNDSLEQLIPHLEKEFFIVHQCGKPFYEEIKKQETETYRVYDFINSDMIALLKSSQVTISRAGAGTVCELLALGKPSILIPLKIAQKNEQYHNAVVARNQLGSVVIEEDELDNQVLLAAIKKVQGLPRHKPYSVNPVDKILEEISKI